jgi:hypothetical protein
MNDFEEVQEYILQHFKFWKNKYFPNGNVSKEDIKIANQELRKVQIACCNHLDYINRHSSMSAEQYYFTQISLINMFVNQFSKLFDLSMEVE